MAIYHKHFEQRSAEWFRVRLGVPTASEFNKIITPKKVEVSSQCYDYMNRLLAEWVLGEPLISEFDSPWMMQGREYEPSAVTSFEFQTGFSTSEVGFVTTDDGLIGASPDRLVADVGTLELKAPAPQTHISYLQDGDALREHYKAQVQGQLWVCEREKAWISSYHPKLPPVILEFGRDEALIEKLSTAVRKFVEIMLVKREDLEKRYGPFERPEARVSVPSDDFGGFGVTMRDAEDIIASWN